ncbi:MAG: type IIL restriction-modification enzyme MmeI [Thermoanaerobaculia bacterium]
MELLLVSGGCAGLLATNTVAQGDTREISLEQLLDRGCTIYRAAPNSKWPGQANLQIAKLWLRKGGWTGSVSLDDKTVERITAFLTTSSRVVGKPKALEVNKLVCFEGVKTQGMGFVVSPEEAKSLILRDPRNREVLDPYLNGEDLTSRPDQSPSRWVINFHDWPLERAEAYADVMRIVREKVKPERERVNDKGEFVLRKPLPQRWWLHGEKRPGLYAAIATLERVLVVSRVSKYFAVAFAPAGWVYNERLNVFSWAMNAGLAFLQNAFHEEWMLCYGSTLETRPMYAPSDCFETFPFPRDASALEDIGSRYDVHRLSIMRGRQEGLTKTYNRFHDVDETSEDIRTLRSLHVEMDEQIAKAYGWDDLNLGHGFHETKQGVRFTLSEIARIESLDRLVQLNHERYAEEVRQGLPEKRARRAPRGKGGEGRTNESLF